MHLFLSCLSAIRIGTLIAVCHDCCRKQGLASMFSTTRVYLASMAIAAALLSGCRLDSASSANDTTRDSSTPPDSATSLSTSAASTASVTVSWQPPDTNVNGSALTDLAGYHIHYGTNSNALTFEIDVPIGLTDYVVEHLNANAIYYFAISAYNSHGVESSNTPTLSARTS